MNEEKKKKLLGYNEEELNKQSPHQVQQLYLETVKEIVEISKSANRHINQLNEYLKKAEKAGNERPATELGEIVELSKRNLIERMFSLGQIIEEIEIENNKTLSIFNKSINNRDKAFVEAMSSDARAHDERIQARRDERYEKMIEEAGKIESPTSKLHR